MEDRELLEAKYTAPSGKEFTFFWEKVSKKTSLKTGIHEFPDKDGAHVQHQGAGALSIPMTCIFNGDNHAKIASDFEAALHERDIAELQHPIYGVKKVIPTGEIDRSEDFTEALGETQIKITFVETITDSPAKPTPVLTSELENKTNSFNDAAAAEFSQNIKTDNISEQQFTESVLKNQNNTMNDRLSGHFNTPTRMAS